MKKISVFFAILAVVLVFGLAFVGCDTGSTTTKFEGRWLNLYASSYGYTDFSYTFTGNNFVFKTAGTENLTLEGTFTFTETALQFTSGSQSWGYTYTLTGNVLELDNPTGNAPGFGPFTKQ